MIALLGSQGSVNTAPVRAPTPDQLWISARALQEATGWVWKPEGLCRQDACVPLAPALRDAIWDGDAIDALALWRALERPALSDAAGSVYVLGESAADRNAQLTSLVAPDFALPDLEGRVHRLSDFRGKKVFVSTWASWCGCRLDLPVWQSLYEELGAQGFVVIAVAMDSRGPDAAREWIENAKPTYPCLIDRNHLLADLYHMVNVPQAVWIDEQGRIVRPTEISGASASQNTDKRAATRAYYCNALRDWVKHGSASRFVFDPTEAAAHVPQSDTKVALAHANFRLGQHLYEHGQEEEGAQLLAAAVELHPDSWNFWRQMRNLKHVHGSYGPKFFARVEAFIAQGKHYYPAPDMPGIKEIYTQK